MPQIVPTELVVDHTYATDLPELCIAWSAATGPAPRLLVLNEALAAELGLDATWLASDDGMATLVGRTVPDGATPVAQAYAGHQFGGYSPRLGDGRALLVGELVDAGGVRRDLHLKGSGRTPFARGGDGKAAVGPMLREYVISEAMHALGIPTTRSLAVVATGEQIARDTMLPGAVLARVAASHVRVGTFQYAAATGGPDLVRRLADHVIARHHPQAIDATNPYLALLECAGQAQARLIARWMLVGFVHGVMNTDNMTISGETIDYGPCAFMDRYDPATVFSSIDHGGRYAYANQPPIGQWNLARLAETLLPLIDDDRERAVERATAVLTSYTDTYTSVWLDGMRAKVGLRTAQPTDRALVDEMLTMLHEQQLDFTGCFRALSDLLTGRAPADATPVDHALDASWVARWRHRLADESTRPEVAAAAMDAVNPVYIPRNHAVEEALAEASDHGDLTPLHRLLDAVRSPFTPRPGLEDLARPAPPSAGPYRTFCGT